tara:strand:- start:6020 stop:7015 length:996 start_codon:yes stop_codon:yes gene_type:complete
MAFEYTNKLNISLPLAVFLMYDSYDHDKRDNVISATGLLRPIKQLVLTQQNRHLDTIKDVSDLVAARMGTAIHDACEKSWSNRNNVLEALKLMGAADGVVDSIRVNPEDPDSLEEGHLAIYVEQRAEKEIMNMIVSGKYDLVLDGQLSDYKSTSVWTYIYGSKIEDYIKQGSIYKWLSPSKITGDTVTIHYIFTDWSASAARNDPKRYPQQRILSKEYPLWSIEETENWIKNKLELYQTLAHSSQEELPECTDEELWATETKYKYYKNPEKTLKSTKNFSTMDAALIKKAEDGNVGTIKEVPGEVRACQYCPVAQICTQAASMQASGRLVL